MAMAQHCVAYRGKVHPQVQRIVLAPEVPRQRPRCTTKQLELAPLCVIRVSFIRILMRP